MLDATATPAMSAGDSRPAITASMVPLPTTARLARNNGHARRKIARVDVSGGAGRSTSALMACDAVARFSSAATDPDSECLVETCAARDFVDEHPVTRWRRVVLAAAPAIALDGNAT